MSATKITDVQDQVKDYWSDLMLDELKQDSIVVNLLSKDYQGEILQGGDTVKVSQIVRPTGATKTIGSGDYDTYSTEKFKLSQIDIKADKIFEAGFEFDSLVELQSQLGSQDSKIRNALKEAIDIQINNYIFSQVSGTNNTGSVTDFNASQISALRKIAGQRKWAKDGEWYCLADSSYHSDMLNAQTLTSQDYIAGEMPVIGGQIANRRFGFNILEDNSDGLLDLIATVSGTDTEDCAIGFHRDFMHLVLAPTIEFKLSDLHASKKRGFLLTAEIIGGVKQGHDHDALHQVVFNT